MIQATVLDQLFSARINLAPPFDEQEDTLQEAVNVLFTRHINLSHSDHPIMIEIHMTRKAMHRIFSSVFASVAVAKYTETM